MTGTSGDDAMVEKIDVVRQYAHRFSKDAPMTAKWLAQEMKISFSTARYLIALARLKKAKVREGLRGPESAGYYL